MRLLGIALLVLFPTSAYALLTPLFSSEQLEAKSTLVCNAVVESVTKGWSWRCLLGYEDYRMTARLKVLHVFKGTASSEVDFHYSREPDPPKFFEQPDWTRLKVGGRYRFFLIPAHSGSGYVNAFPELIDESNEVQILCAAEADDSPYISTEEARKLANTYALQHGLAHDSNLFEGAPPCVESAWNNNHHFPGGGGTWVTFPPMQQRGGSTYRLPRLYILGDRRVVLDPD